VKLPDCYRYCYRYLYLGVDKIATIPELLDNALRLDQSDGADIHLCL
jgi:hypothetical protein